MKYLNESISPRKQGVCYEINLINSKIYRYKRIKMKEKKREQIKKI